MCGATTDTMKTANMVYLGISQDWERSFSWRISPTATSRWWQALLPMFDTVMVEVVPCFVV
jgi:hypothetical protein